MIPPLKFGKLVLLNPAKGRFRVITLDGRMMFESHNPAEALNYIKNCFITKIDEVALPLIQAEGYDLAGNPANAESSQAVKKGSSTKGKKAGTELSAESQALFDKFWEVYPKKVAKIAAVKAWKKLDPDWALTDKIIHALEVQIEVYKWSKGGEFIPHAATWLNGKRWEDIITLAATPKVTSGGSSFDLNAIMEHAKTHKPEV